MSANNSLSDSSTSGDPTMASQYALRVALQTMKERCISLQERLSALKEENLVLQSRQKCDHPQDNGGSFQNRSEVELLRNQVAELTRQKFQLSEHIAMVATENRQLWSRLSQLAKDKGHQKMSATSSTSGVCTTSTVGAITSETASGQNLIRSKTFTQHSPNPNIRPKHIPSAGEDKSLDDMSLEEVSLKVLNNFNDAKTEVDKKCGEILAKDGNGLGFGYLHDDVSDGDVTLEAKKCIDGMMDIKKELLKQQDDLKKALGAMKEKKALQECPACKERRKLEMVDKNLETDPCLLENYKNPNKGNNTVEIPSAKQKTEDNAYNGNRHLYILEQKRLADEMDKMCPLCGKFYSSSVSFESFQEHVETHFIDDSDLDPSVERNFEFVSHTVSNF